jgi:hypothetical protein
MKAILILGSAILLSACTAQAVVPPVSVDTPLGEAPVAGNYAATVQTGGWALQTKSKAFSCGAWTFDTDVNSSYEDALRNALTRSLEKVDFTPEILSPDDLRRKGYNAQIVVHQGNADSSFLVSTRWFSTTARADVELSVILANSRRDRTNLSKHRDRQGIREPIDLRMPVDRPSGWGERTDCGANDRPRYYPSPARRLARSARRDKALSHQWREAETSL